MYYICSGFYEEDNLRGVKKPLFYIINLEQSKILALVNEALQINKSLFLIDLKISSDAKIKVIVDGDQGVPLKECIRISRHIEHNLNRDVKDFSLEVMSAGLSEPLSLKRQFKKNIDRTLKIKLIDGTKIEGNLDVIDDEGINISWKVREPKPVGKGKITVVKNAQIAFKNIKEAKVKIKYN